MSIITKSNQLLDVCKKIDECGRFGMDLEFIPERTYTAQLCLVQVSTDTDAFIIDPLALNDLSPLWERIADPKLLKVLHAADQDLDLSYTASGLVPQNIIDTQIAAGFLGFGYPVGYGKLLQSLLGITISKTESFTDWTARPLTQSQIDYAIDDVRHLLPMYDKLAAQLDSMQRFTWVQEECAKYSHLKSYQKDRSHDFMRIKGANGLNRRGLAVLRELCDWRHREAAQANRPLRSTLQDGTLLEFARRPPKEFADLQRIRGTRPDQLRQYGTALLDAVKTGLTLPDAELPKWPSTKIPSRREVLMADVLYTVLRVTCFDLDIAPELVATRTSLETLVRRYGEGTLGESTLQLLHGWRYEMAGKILVDLLQGSSLKMQFRNDEHPVAMQVTND